MTTVEEKIQARIDVLRTELNKLVEDANKQIAVYQAAIGELEAIIAPPDEVKAPEVVPAKKEKAK